MKKRIIGLDYGSKTVGVAVSDPLGFTAQGLEIIQIDEDKQLRVWRRLLVRTRINSERRMRVLRL